MNAKLADLLPKEAKDEHAKALLIKGAVLRLYSSDINNPKTKRFVIIGIIDQTVGKVYINTDPQSSSSQVKFESTDRDYLNHDSYIDCSEIYPDDYRTLISRLASDFDCYLGKVSDADMLQITQTLVSARTISLKKKQLFGLIKPLETNPSPSP